MSFAEMHTKTIRVAQNLQALGYERREVFGIIASCSNLVTPIVLASIAIGCPINPLNPDYGKTELIHKLKMTKPALMFCDTSAYELVKKCLDELGNASKIFVFGESIGGSESVRNLFKETHIEDQFWYAQ